MAILPVGLLGEASEVDPGEPSIVVAVSLAETVRIADRWTWTPRPPLVSFLRHPEEIPRDNDMTVTTWDRMSVVGSVSIVSHSMKGRAAPRALVVLVGR